MKISSSDLSAQRKRMEISPSSPANLETTRSPEGRSDRRKDFLATALPLVTALPVENCDLFENLFIFEMANNHQGDLEHGLSIISEIASIANEEGINAGIKFQYRQLDSFVHPNSVNRKNVKHVPRFVATRLPMEKYKIMSDEAKQKGLLTIGTAFDEESVPIIEKHEIDIMKVGSCSLTDWPLLKEIARSRKPTVISTGGGDIKNIDKIVSFFSHQKIPFALMHCIAIYPTQNEDLQLNQIDYLKRRYPFLKIGFSTHESPDQTIPVQMAIAKGAKIFEKHIGVETNSIKLNDYSANPSQARKWVKSAKVALNICGSSYRLAPKKEEIESLCSLKRGVFAKGDIKAGEKFCQEDVYFAIPYVDGYADSGMLNKNVLEMVSLKDIKKNDPIPRESIISNSLSDNLYSVIHRAKGLLYEGRVAIGKTFDVTLSHHFGPKSFDKVGAIIIDIVNRKYCKKLLIQVAGQFHPSHFHKKKEETFQVLFGNLTLKLEEKEYNLSAGDVMLIKPGQKHSFWTKTGVIIEEISTTHFNSDSFYSDDRIENESRLRKTLLENAGHTFEQWTFDSK
jgi:sialic acid synthase SpsE/mannose-6-phosphate isomerase-like protein (cupin superfamily)